MIHYQYFSAFSCPFFDDLNFSSVIKTDDRQKRAPPVCRQGEPTYVEVRSLWRHGEAGCLGGILTTASEGGTAGVTFRLVVLESLPVAVHGTLEDTKTWTGVHTNIYKKSRHVTASTC